MLIYADLGRTHRNLAALTVLSMLAAGPRRADEMHQTLTDAGRYFLADNLHDTCEVLEQDGFLQPDGEAFALTDAGREEALLRVDDLVRTPTSSSEVTYAAMSFISLLSRDRAVAALQHRAEKLAEMVETLENKVASAAEAAQLLIETHYELTRLRSEEEWVANVAEKLQSEVLAWPEG